MPLFFSSNLVIGRAAVGSIEPFTLAFLRWSGALLLLLPIAVGGLAAHRIVLVSQWRWFGVLGALAMGVCGALVYVALQYTTASNATLIYTTSPLFILVLEWAFRGRRIQAREALGIVLAMAGIAAIVAHGDWRRLTQMTFNVGDLLILLAAIAWAVYSVAMRRPSFASLPTATVFAATCIAGVIILAPFALIETVYTQRFPVEAAQWQAIFGLALVSSVLAFLSYQFAVKIKGPALTGIFMYLMPPFGVGLAVVALGETLQLYHGVGFGLILAGLVLATAPVAWISERLRPASGTSA
jgi:drug/metabolite transporter (DMT)-like permease